MRRNELKEWGKRIGKSYFAVDQSRLYSSGDKMAAVLIKEVKKSHWIRIFARIRWYFCTYPNQLEITPKSLSTNPWWLGIWLYHKLLEYIMIEFLKHGPTWFTWNFVTFCCAEFLRTRYFTSLTISVLLIVLCNSLAWVLPMPRSSRMFYVDKLSNPHVCFCGRSLILLSRRRGSHAFLRRSRIFDRWWP